MTCIHYKLGSTISELLGKVSLSMTLNNSLLTSTFYVRIGYILCVFFMEHSEHLNELCWISLKLDCIILKPIPGALRRGLPSTSLGILTLY